MAKSEDDLPYLETTEPLDHEDAPEIGPNDSEIDFDDEREDDQQTLDVVEAMEVGVMLDDPEVLSDEDD